ncbi:hypothetical protein niasHT_038567 [Heterodera trifolii]|uniref:Uncharacterized protein n=1 Tax=Heterodera trifolii TaxID=157864 RepID=A0ABD2HYQ7_9BILA
MIKIDIGHYFAKKVTFQQYWRGGYIRDQENFVQLHQKDLEWSWKSERAIDFEWMKLNTAKEHLERQLEVAKNRLEQERQRAEETERNLKSAEMEKDSLIERIEALKDNLKRCKE